MTKHIVLTSGLTDYGQGSRTVFTLVAAEELGVQPQRIQMLRPDTDTALESGPTVASRSTVLGGNATRMAGRNMVQLLDMAAADLLGCLPSQLMREGESYVGPGEEPVAWEKVVDHARQMGLVLSTHGKWAAPTIHWDPATGQGSPYFLYHFAADVVEVEVDTGTGKTNVTGVWAVHDSGKVVFPQGAYGQIYGGVAQGLGYALTENFVYDKGYPQTINFDEYLIPTSMDLPDIEAASSNTNSIGPYEPRTAEPAWCRPHRHVERHRPRHGVRIRELPPTGPGVLGHDLPGRRRRLCKLGLRAR